MPPKKNPWFRWYTEMFSDPKIRRLPVEQRWAWGGILGAASDSPSRGRLVIADGEPMTVADLADYAGVKPTVMKGAVEYGLKLGMLARDEAGVITVTKFVGRQFLSDSSTERSRKHRSKDEGSNNDATLHHQSMERPDDRSSNVPPSVKHIEQRTENRLKTVEEEGYGSVAPANATTPPPDHCSQHPSGWPERCSACGAARRQRTKWDRDHAAELAKLKAACPYCHGSGIREHPETGDPLGRCDHQPDQARTA